MGVFMADVLNLIGQKYGKLLVVSRNFSKKRVAWNCLCECGRTSIVTSDALRCGKTRSCGCLVGKSNIKHGACINYKDSSLYKRWQHMRDRCYNVKNKRYKDYGGREITVCDSWLESFLNYKNDVGEIPFKGAQLDRIDNDGNYEPSNIRWVTPKENSNNRRTTHPNYKGIING